MSGRIRSVAIMLSCVLLMSGLCACSAAVNMANSAPADKVEEAQPQAEEPVEETSEPAADTPAPDEMTEEDTVVLPELESVPFDMNVYGEDGDYKVFESYGNSYLLSDVSSRDYPKLAQALKAIDEDEKASYQKTIDSNLKDAEEFAKEQQKEGNDYSYMSYSETQLKASDDRVVSLLRTEYGYLGGAHPDYYYETFNLYTKTGENIPLSDIVTDNDKLKSVLKDKLNKEYPDGNFFDLDESLDIYVTEEKAGDDEHFPYKFTINAKGLLFYFGPYDLNSYADGAQTVDIQYDEIADILKSGFIYEDFANEEINEAEADDASAESAKNDLAVFAPGFTGLTNIRNENNDDGTYFYEDMTSDGMTKITNMCAHNSQRDKQAEDAYVENFVCALIDNDANITETEFDEDLSTLITNTVQKLSAYEIEYTSGSNEDTKVGKGIVLLTDNFTYYYGFSCPIDYFDETEGFYEDELENISLINLK